MKKAILLPVLALLLGSCNPYIDEGIRKNDLNRGVELVTDFGTVVFRLSDETPLHRNNYRLANSPPYQELLTLHRKLEEEMPGNDSLANVQVRKEALAALIRQDTPRYTIPPDHREAYKTIGGAAHLDQNYTVFGEVIRGMDVVDFIASVPTDKRDRPLEDVRIIRARLVRRW